MRMYLFIVSLLFCGVSFAQNTTISGSVTDVNNQPVSGANVRLVGETSGTITDSDGNFKLNVTGQPPYVIEVTSVGFGMRQMDVRDPAENVSVMLAAQETKLDEIVVSASRTPERVLESPVTIERMGSAEIRNVSSPSFYDALENLKEVHFNTSSLSFKSINTRGFATVANTRFMQLVDGMDNSSPALNFVLGNLIGISELDVASVELLPGASSALYGANAFNGILFMNSKSPFTNQGISMYFKYGKTSQEAAGTNDYYDFGIRMAHAFSKKVAAKANFTYLKGTEWIAGDFRSMTGGSVGHENNQNYDGLNMYGDEVTTFINNVGQVSRTGYREQDLNDNKIENVKADISIHYRPWANDFEMIFQNKTGLGTTIYQGANRYALKNFMMNQTKFEVKNRNFFVRAYMTTEDAGDSYDMRFAAWNVNQMAKSNTEWFTNYATAYQLSSAVLGVNANEAATIGRNYADFNQLPAGLQGLPQFAVAPTGSPRFLPGSPEFRNALQAVTDNPDLTQGAKFLDESKLYHVDVNYNFKELIDIAEIQLGGSFREYELNSKGTIFTDFDGPIFYDEYGVYTQVTKRLLKEERLKFTGSLRYDKSQNFDGFVSPRIALVYSAGAEKRHNFRVSYQTGFRNPTTQDQYIGLDLGPFALIGSAPDNLSRYVEVRENGVNGVTISPEGQAILGSNSATLSGNSAYQNSFTLASVQQFDAARTGGQSLDAASQLLDVAEIGLVKPERVQAFEVGYRSVVKDFSIDVNAYYNIYNDFLNQARVYTPYYGDVHNTAVGSDVLTAIDKRDRRVFQIYTNSRTEVTSYGVGVGLSKKVYKDFEVGVNYNYAAFDFDQAEDPSFVPGFNTPKNRFKASLGNTKLFKNFGFNINVRWSDEYLWQASFADGIVPENTVLDAQVSYALPKLKSLLKVGAANLFGEDYTQVIGAGQIGQQWFVQLTINP